MFARLQNKPFYFITDRQTHLQFFVNKSNTSQPEERLVYYPVEYQTMTERQIQKYKNKVRNQFFRWTIFNLNKLDNSDKNIVFWRLFDSFSTILLGLLSAKFLRKLMFRSQLPVIEMKLESLGFNVRLLKAYTAYFICFLTTKKMIEKILDEQYLTDLAFEYKYNFSQKMHSPCDQILNQVSQKRFNQTSATATISQKSDKIQMTK